jgi:two-component system phosphate regulon sensor histidine kinase PhoR
VEDLSDISKIEDGRLVIHPAPLDLERIVRETVNSLVSTIEEKGLRIEIALAPDIPAVLGDPQRVGQIFTNLVSNACRYTPAGGQITIASNRVNGTAEMIVQDTGIGIREDDLERIFERFYRSDDPLVQEHSGTGLGLAIAKSLVELHGGQLWVKSKVGEGSSFGFTLPVAGGDTTDRLGEGTDEL